MQLVCLVATDRVIPFPSDKVQQMGASGRARRGFQAGPHSSLPFFDGTEPRLQKAASIASQPESLSAQGVFQKPVRIRLMSKRTLILALIALPLLLFGSENMAWGTLQLLLVGAAGISAIKDAQQE